MSEFITLIVDYWTQFGSLIMEGTRDTLLMTFIATGFAYLGGIPLGVLLTVTAPGSLRPNRFINATLGWVVNIGRSLPFIILIVVLIPVTRAIVGTSLGVPGAIVPLAIAATPFVARIIENALAEIPSGVIEAAQSYGASLWQIITKVFLREALPSILRSAAIVIITVFGYTAIAGTVGAGGLGDIAIRYGVHRFQTDILMVILLVIVVLIQLIQTFFDIIVRKVDKRN